MIKIKNSKTKLIAKSINRTLKSSTIHGVSNIARKKLSRVVKLIWLCCFIISSTSCFIFIVRNANLFFDNEVISKIEVIFKNKLEFPIVSICNTNPYAMQYLGNHTPKENQYKLFILKCTFNGFEDCVDDFARIEGYRDENCFKFNYGKDANGQDIQLRYVNRKEVGLVIEMFAGFIDDFKDDVETNMLYIDESGYQITLSDKEGKSLKSNSYYEGSAFKVSAGYSTSIILNKYKITQLPRPYSNCIGNLTSIDSYESECYKRTFSPNRTYRFSDCSSYCFQRFIGIECSCQVAYFKKFFINMSDCDLLLNKEHKDCEQHSWEMYSRSTKVIDQCDCPHECMQSGYTYTYSIAQYPTRLYANYLLSKEAIHKKLSILLNRTNLTYDNLKQSLVKVNIFYEDLKQTLITHRPKKEVADLVSDIGGTFGLFLGISFLSLIEFVEIFFQVILILLDAGKNYGMKEDPTLKLKNSKRIKTIS